MMKSKTFGVAGAAALVLVVLVQACGGSDPDPVGPAEDAGADSTSAADTGSGNVDTDGSGGGECTTNDDCKAKLPVTTPADCAVATCDSLQKKCHFKAKDSDGDGHPAKSCTATSGTIETGDDCDDADPNTYPGAWDGPATDFDSGAGVQADRCDQRDNDCNGSPDDGKLKVDGGDKTCKCDPNHPLPCYEYPNGTPIDPSTLDLNNTPKGICKKGTRTCVAGVPSACSGAVGPQPAEQCDTLDHDCNGVTGNGGDTVATAPIWYKDTDNDNYGDSAMAPKQQCVSPAGLWKNLIPNTDCDDGDPQRNPGLTEVCDGKDNNCNVTVDEGVKTNFCADVDNDTYCTATCVQACVAPNGYRQQNTCAGGTDCDDSVTGANIHPNAADLCGDGIDSNCVGGDNDQYPTFGQACATGGFGVCKRTGVQACVLPARTSVQCNATPGTAKPAGDTVMSNDPLIDMSQARASYDPRWDWNCDNVQTVDDLVAAGGPLQVGIFRSRACSGNFVSACDSISDADTCNKGVFGTKFYNCDQIGGQYIDPLNPAMCGRTYRMIGCFWGAGGASGCAYLNNANLNFGTVDCK